MSCLRWIPLAILSLIACSGSDGLTAADNTAGTDGSQNAMDGSMCDATAASYADVSPTIREYCLDCHTAEKSGIARAGAPVSVDFDTEEQVAFHASRMYVRAVLEGTMPIGKTLPECKRMRLGAFLLGSDEGVCTADCAGRECGDDGCGGSCGTCSAALSCDNGNCICPTCEATDTCATADPCPCEPSCTDKQCGDDGCGGSCGQCAAGLQCSAAGQCTCEPNCSGRACQPDCLGRQCGDDGCGGSCGTCQNGTCTLNQCVCEADCSAKQCGDDGCGGSCGTCASGQLCAENLCEYPEKTFGGDVFPLFSGCNGSNCHDSSQPAGSLDLSNQQSAYSALVGQNSSSALCQIEVRVVPGEPSNSYLINKLTGAGTICGSRMPKVGSAFTTEQIDIIRAWIGNGADM